MPKYRLTRDAEDDLRQIARYTTKTWGSTQAIRYKATLKKAFEVLADGATRTKLPLKHRPDIRSSRCEHHYVFSVHEPDKAVVIVAVLHENMDLPTRLRKRLDTS